MPSIRKAARGKRRWVAVKIEDDHIDEKILIEKISQKTRKPKLAWISEDGCHLILEVKLEEYTSMLNIIRDIDHAETTTSSGKIRLVKSRIYSNYDH